METEPALKARIRQRRSRLARSLVLLALISIIALIFIFVIVPYLAGITTFSPLVRRTGEVGHLLLLILPAVLLDLIFAALYLPGMFRDRSYYRKLTATSQEYEMGRLAVFMNALDGACIKAGAPEPGVAVLRGASANALSFKRKNTPMIGITADLLKADLSYKEIEGVMAHQLACVMAGDCLVRPGVDSFEFFAYVLLGAYSVTALAATAMVGAGRGLGIGIAFLAAAAAILFLIGFSIGRLRNNRAHDFLLADSTAVAITGNHAELSSAIRKIDVLVNKKARGTFPENELGLKFWFVPAYRWSETAEQFVARRHSDLDMNSSEASVQRQVGGVHKSMDELAGWAEELLKDRLVNLED
jgi:Zn-dependent protease with chaperone function